MQKLEAWKVRSEIFANFAQGTAVLIGAFGIFLGGQAAKEAFARGEGVTVSASAPSGTAATSVTPSTAAGAQAPRAVVTITPDR